MRVPVIGTVILLAVMAASSYAWRNGGNNIRWDYNCDFYGLDIDAMDIPIGDCAPSCLNNRQCTHFAYRGVRCHLKRNTEYWKELAVRDRVCGFIRGRSKQYDGPRTNTRVI